MKITWQMVLSLVVIPMISTAFSTVLTGSRVFGFIIGAVVLIVMGYVLKNDGAFK